MSWERSSARLLILQATQLLVSFLLLGGASLFWANQGSPTAGVLLPLLAFVYAPIRVTWIIARWIMETYQVTTHMITVRTGVLRRQERHLDWASLVAVDEKAGLFFRALGIRRILLTQSDSAGGGIVLRALPAQTAATIRELVRTQNRSAKIPYLAPPSRESRIGLHGESWP